MFVPGLYTTSLIHHAPLTHASLIHRAPLTHASLIHHAPLTHDSTWLVHRLSDSLTRASLTRAPLTHHAPLTVAGWFRFGDTMSTASPSDSS